ncbi:hypothetical protein OR221_0714 [Microbacterium laevaniformans OR221]|nr:hypothetical protein OR221_0714 [Microbacterium laevaniformans OR221]
MSILTDATALRTDARGRRWIPITVLSVAAVLSFALHFRPGEVAFLEEWPLAEYWNEHGLLGFAAHYGPWSASRPLHLVPTALGLLLGGGSPVGIFAILGLVAAGQFLLVMWALKPVQPPFVVAVAIGLFVSLHPLWAAGYLQRFLPAQTAVLVVIVVVGAVVRFVGGGRVHWLWIAGACTAIALCIYPGPAAAVPLLTLSVCLAMKSSLRRLASVIAAVLVPAALVTLYSLVVVRVFTPSGSSYESSTVDVAAVASPVQTLTMIADTLVAEGRLILLAMVVVIAIAVTLGVTRIMTPRSAVVMAVVALCGPACAVVFFGNASWLHDIDRVSYASSLGALAALLAWPLAAARVHRGVQTTLALALIAVSVVGAVRGVESWQPFISLQHKLFTQIAPIAAEVQEGQIIVVVDHSGTYGSEYTLPQYYISSASHIMTGRATQVWLCSMPGDPPLDSAGECTVDALGPNAVKVSTFEVPHGSVDIYLASKVPNG